MDILCFQIHASSILNNQWDDYFFPSFKKCCLHFPIIGWFSANVCPRTWLFLQCISLAHVKLHSDWLHDKTYRHTGTKSSPFTTKPGRWKVCSSGHCLNDYWLSKLDALLPKTQGSTRCQQWQVLGKWSGSEIAQFSFLLHHVLDTRKPTLLIKATRKNKLKS